MSDLTAVTAVRLAGAVGRGEVSAVEVVAAHLEAIGDDPLNAFTLVDGERALDRIDEIEGVEVADEGEDRDDPDRGQDERQLDLPERRRAGDAIDLAGFNDLIMVRPSTYNELVVMWKPVQLQGFGEGSTVINAVKAPTEKLQIWRGLVDGLITAGSIFGFIGGAVDTRTVNRVARTQDPLPGVDRQHDTLAPEGGGAAADQLRIAHGGRVHGDLVGTGEAPAFIAWAQRDVESAIRST